MDTNTTTEIKRLAAFSDGATGGNPAGVVVGKALPSEAEMQKIAERLGTQGQARIGPEACPSMGPVPGTGPEAWCRPGRARAQA